MLQYSSHNKCSSFVSIWIWIVLNLQKNNWRSTNKWDQKTEPNKLQIIDISLNSQINRMRSTNIRFSKNELNLTDKWNKCFYVMKHNCHSFVDFEIFLDIHTNPLHSPSTPANQLTTTLCLLTNQGLIYSLHNLIAKFEIFILFVNFIYNFLFFWDL